MERSLTGSTRKPVGAEAVVPPLFSHERRRKEEETEPPPGGPQGPEEGALGRGLSHRKKKSPSGWLQRKKKARLEARHLPPGHNRMHTMAAVRLETDVRQVERREGVVAGPGTSLKDILHGVVPPVKSPGSAHPPNFVGMHGEVRPVAVGETNTGLDPTGHRLSRRCSFPSNLHKQALFGN